MTSIKETKNTYSKVIPSVKLASEEEKRNRYKVRRPVPKFDELFLNKNNEKDKKVSFINFYTTNAKIPNLFKLFVFNLY